MIRVMLDTDVLSDLDGNFPLLATYADLVPTRNDLTDLEQIFRDSDIILIDRGLGDPLGLASVIDIETGSHGVADIPGWVTRKRADNIRYLTGYCDRNNLPGVEEIGRNELWHWVATLDGTAHIDGFIPMRQPAAVQILGETAIGIHGDLSLVLESSWHPQP